jgi:hypothetical protein
VILVFILAVSAGIVCLAVGIDIGSQVWTEKRAWREAEKARVVEAKNLIVQGIHRKFETTMEMRTVRPKVVVPLEAVRVVEKPVHGRHRLVAA